MSNSTASDAIAGFIAVSVAILGIALLVAVGALLNGFTLSYLWAWFVLPVFPGMPVLTIGRAVGLSLIVGFLTTRYHRSPKETSDEWYTPLVYIVVAPLLSLAFGWVVHVCIS